MKNFSRVGLLCAGLLWASVADARHRFVIQGENRLAIVAADGKVEWEMPWGGIHDLHVLPSGNLMVQQGSSKVVEIDRQSRKVVWSYDSATANGNTGKRVEVHAFQPLPDGRLMIAESGPARIIEIDRQGKLLSEVRLKVEKPNPHTDTRLARKLDSGNYLVCHEADGAVREYAPTGEVVWEYRVPLFGREPKGGHGPEAFGNKVFSAVRLAGGNTLIGAGNGHSVLEVTREGKIVWELHQRDLPGITLAWVTTVEVSPGGNYVIGNCHAGPDNPVLIEVDPKTKQVVWRYDGFAQFGNNVSNSRLLAAVDADQAALRLDKLEHRVLPQPMPEMLSRDIRRRLSEANQRESAAWNEIKSLDDWRRYVQPRIKALKDKLGIQELPGTPPQYEVTKRIEGEGYEIQNVVFESRPGLAVTANLYRPREPKGPMPAILIVHSHHAPKTQSELQDMGITWARQGAIVLVMDMPGHGERRQHKFIDESSYPKSFRVSRQDYFFRYNLGVQLPLVGQSLMSWMVHDLRRGIDLVVSLPQVDKTRIALLGAVAGGGDPCAVTAAVDERITATAPFNFGGPQPETTYPLPENAETSFNYAGGGSWESTRNLQFSASEGFLPWVIVGSLAPRGLIYGHEFAWDQPRDPVWRRLETIFGFHNARDRLNYAIGRGRLSGQPPESSHCTNIGPLHRERIYLALADWFKLPVPEKEANERRPASELHAMTREARGSLVIHRHVAQAVDIRESTIPPQRPKDRREYLMGHWSKSLGDAAPIVPKEVTRQRDADAPRLERVVLETEAGIQVPLLLLLPDAKLHPRPPVVIGLAQAGKQGFLEHRSETISRLLAGGAAVCLPDLRGTGETRPGDGRGRTSSATSLSASAWMLGQTMFGWRLKDLRSTCRWLEQRDDLDAKRIVLWGESFAPVNDPKRDFAVPWDAEDLPLQSEPGGALLALFGGLFEENVRGLYGHGGLASYRSILDSPYIYVPHDDAVPFALSRPETDLPHIAAALLPRKVKLEGQVDGLNRPAGETAASSQAELAEWLLSASK